MATQNNSITISGGGVTANVWDMPGDPAVNWFYCRTGAANYGSGLFLITRSDYDKLVPGFSTTIVTLTMKSNQGPGLSMPVIIAGCEPYSTVTGPTNKAGNQPTDLMKVKLVDQRRFKFTPFDQQFNEMSQIGGGFSYDTTNNINTCYPETLASANTPFTWAQIFAAVGAPAMPAGSVPTWIPYNITYDSVPLARAVDDLLNRLFFVCGWDLSSQSWTCNVPGVMTLANAALYAQGMAGPYTAGGIGERNVGGLPASFLVGFRSFNADDQTDPYNLPSGYHRTLTFSQTVNLGSGPAQPLPCNQNYAIWQAGAYANNTQLSAIAADIAPRAYAAMAVEPQQRQFQGIWPFSPDGAIRSVLWVSNCNEAKTVIRINNDRDANPLDDLRRVIEESSNQFLIGLGLDNVTMDAGNRARQIWSASQVGAWYKLTTPIPPYSTGGGSAYVGGGAMYNGRTTTGMPVTVDLTTDLIIPQSPGTVASTDNIVLENVAEANLGDPPSHWVQNNTFVFGWPSGKMSVNDPSGNPRPIISFYSPRPGPTIMAVQGWSTTNPPTLGKGTYYANPMRGNGVGVNAANASAAPTTPDQGTGFPTGINNTVVFRNILECGNSTLDNQWLLDATNGGNQQLGIGMYMGMCVVGATAYPMFYGLAMPTWTLFPVMLTWGGGSGDGSDGSPGNPVTYRYTGTLLAGFSGSPFIPGQPIFDPSPQRSSLNDLMPTTWLEQSFIPAIFGLAGVGANGQAQLVWAFEVPNGLTSTITFVDNNTPPRTNTVSLVSGTITGWTQV